MSERKLSTAEIVTILIIIALLAMFLLAGCTTVNYNPETKDFKYSSPPWGRKIGSVSVLREADGSILFEMQDYHSENVSAIVEGAVKGAVGAMK